MWDNTLSFSLMTMWHRKDLEVFIYSTVDYTKGCQGYGWACHGITIGDDKMTLQPKAESEVSKLGNKWESALRIPVPLRTKLGTCDQGDSQGLGNNHHALPVPGEQRHATPAMVTSRAEAKGEKH